MIVAGDGMAAVQNYGFWLKQVVGQRIFQVSRETLLEDEEQVEVSVVLAAVESS